jgi:hypothetical protein
MDPGEVFKRQEHEISLTRVRTCREFVLISYMKTTFCTLSLVAVCQFLPVFGRAQDIDSAAAVVVKTVPEAGSKEVAPGTVEIRVSFSKEMKDQSWSWSSAWDDSMPKTVGKPRYEADGRTCVLKVTLEPNKTYGYWLNSQKFHGFQDKQGRPALPYLLTFRTKNE